MDRLDKVRVGGSFPVLAGSTPISIPFPFLPSIAHFMESDPFALPDHSMPGRNTNAQGFDVTIRSVIPVHSPRGRPLVL